VKNFESKKRKIKIRFFFVKYKKKRAKLKSKVKLAKFNCFGTVGLRHIVAIGKIYVQNYHK